MNDSSFDSKPKRANRAWRIALAVLVILAISWAIVARHLGSWLVVQDPLEHSGAIVVLSGGLPYRALEAAKIYREGMAPEIWVTRSWHSPAIDELIPDFNGEEFYSERILIREGVPATSIKLLEPVVVNTEEEVRIIAEQMRASGISRVIIATSPPHTRRVRAIWTEVAPKGFEAIVRPASMEPYDAQHWWRNTKDALDVTREMLGLLNAWAGLPLKHLRR